jgi:hypothetical protein
MSVQFSKPEPKPIDSNKGFLVKVLGRTGLRYAEGEQSVWIVSEVLGRPRAIAVVKTSIRFWERPQPTEVDAKDRDRIAQNIQQAFEACGCAVEIQEPFDWSSVAVRPPKGHLE